MERIIQLTYFLKNKKVMGFIKKMVQTLRIKLVRILLGKHCPCYQMGYHKLKDYTKSSIGNKV
jgi:hypothetical protein